MKINLVKKIFFVTSNINMTQTKKQLRTIAKERWLKGYSKYKKADLVKFLKDNQPAEVTETMAMMRGLTLKQLQIIAKERGLKSNAKLKKIDLVELIRENQSF